MSQILLKLRIDLASLVNVQAPVRRRFDPDFGSGQCANDQSATFSSNIDTKLTNPNPSKCSNGRRSLSSSSDEWS